MVTNADKANVCVYFLRDPRDMQVRYVGISNNPNRRLAQQWSERVGGRKCGIDRANWFRELDLLAMRPVLHVVFTGATKHQARAVEHRLVSQWMRNRTGQLLQAKTHLFDPIDSVRELWEKSNVKQRKEIKRFVESQLIVTRTTEPSR